VRETVLSATILALALTGDALLYVVLPAHADAFGVDLAMVGILLSANRIIRIFGYGAVVAAGERLGARRLSLIAAALAAATTFAYGLGSGFVQLLAGRVGWGLAFAALNLTSLVYAASVKEGTGRSVGLAGAIRQAGPTVALAAGAALVPVAGPQGIFIALGLLTLAAVPMAAALPPAEPRAARGPRSLLPRPGRLDLMYFVVTLSVDGIFTITLTLLLADLVSVESAVLSAGLVLALKGLVQVVLSPIGGILGDRYGAARLMAAAQAVLVAGLVLVAGAADRSPTLLLLGMATVAASRAVLQVLILAVAARRNPEDSMRSFSVLATWGDLGSAVGPLIAGFLFAAVSAQGLYLGMAAAIAAAALFDRLARQKD
jgi:MFS family permease